MTESWKRFVVLTVLDTAQALLPLALLLTVRW